MWLGWISAGVYTTPFPRNLISSDRIEYFLFVDCPCGECFGIVREETIYTGGFSGGQVEGNRPSLENLDGL